MNNVHLRKHTSDIRGDLLWEMCLCLGGGARSITSAGLYEAAAFRSCVCLGLSEGNGFGQLFIK